MDPLTGFHMLEAGVLFRSHPNKLRRTERIQSFLVLDLVFSDETFNQERDGYPIVSDFFRSQRLKLVQISMLRILGSFSCYPL